ncbi:hypothetical protein EHEL_061180 [Encephalitozoon hellem ATCC 50504]|uniref:Tetratricopeptide repeat protein n=1 Tax=Encephalitozoon hellem TaxID=27973 RepID=A0A9Q9C8G6_ENCHE|nr:uncharacterized protein EHEL_061180 [Encephalitozoon hellem ATCC 50504]AFM98489.1 hypothetical protein EHEL_061180 [Encephalitozoon hellem ATCC 50504]UTX43415.1 hypothetical protein GPU96_06g11640 [Encephalitozoon hellem]|eukprot:XP_003887470.1 hypothetical protein EHEL_061180 [Encephalitozoon hellem ATCC 50504]
MVIKISTGDDESISFDAENPPLGLKFDELLKALEAGDVPALVQYKIAHGYRRHPKLAMKILEQLSRVDDKDYNTLLLLLACRLQAGMDGIDVVQRMEFYESPMLDILKGFVSLKKKSYDSALFLFGKARFALGIQICNYYLGNIGEAKKFDSKVLRGYCLLKEARDNEELGEIERLFRDANKKDLLFGLGLGDEYEDEGNIDVKMRLVGELVDREEFPRAHEMMETMPNNAEILYLRGKIEHKKRDFEAAKKYYMESLGCDRNFIKSEYNLQRIVQDKMGNGSYRCSEFSDFKAYLDLKNKSTDMNLEGCSEDFRNAVLAVLGENTKRVDTLVRRYMRLIGNPWIENFVVMNNIGYSLCRYLRPFEEYEERQEGNDRFLIGSIGIDREDNKCLVDGEMIEDRVKEAEKYLRRALDECPDEYKEVIRYNLGYVTEDRGLLAELSLEESRRLLSVEGEEASSIPNELELLGFYHMRRKEFKLAKKIFQKLDTLYSSIGLGNIYIRSFCKDRDSSALGKAMKAFAKGMRSYYCGNGIGICLALKGRLEEAINIFNNVTIDWVGGYVNLGNTLILCKRYREAMDVFSKISSMRYSRQMLEKLCRIVNEVDGYRLCVDAGIPGAKEKLFELLVEQSRFEEAEKLRVVDQRLMKMYDEKKEEEKKRKEELRRKAEEMREYRKRRR